MTVSLFSFGIGVSLGFLMIYVGKFKDYVIRKKNEKKSNFMKVVDILWRILLPIIFGIIAFAIPAKIIFLVLNQRLGIENTSSYFLLYLCGFLISFGTSMIIFIKLGKIKATTKWPPY